MCVVGPEINVCGLCMKHEQCKGVDCQAKMKNTFRLTVWYHLMKSSHVMIVIVLEVRIIND